MIYLHNATLYTPFKKIKQGVLICDGEKIVACGRADELTCPIGAEPVDVGGLSLVPGFIDLQINGASGMDFTSDPEIIWQVGERLLRYGVTAYLPTIISSPEQTVQQARTVIGKGPPTGYLGAQALGLHLEGPYLNPEKAGAHDPAHLCLPQPDAYDQWRPDSAVRLVTLAPELPGALQAVRTLVSHGVVVGAGHSLASYEQAMDGIEAGIRYGTHLFNAMPPLDHRHPGLAGALMVDNRACAGMIVDGIHLHPRAVELAWKLLGARRTSLVTDAMAALGMPSGIYQLAGRAVHVDEGSTRLEDGRLAGSILSLDQAVRNLMAFTNCTLEGALPSVTSVPAHMLGLGASLGCLAPGARADFVLISQDVHVVEVWISGRRVFPAEK